MREVEGVRGYGNVEEGGGGGGGGGGHSSEELRRICMDGWVMAGAIGCSQGYAKAWQGWQSPKQTGSSP
jgi:hypothetical protein